MFNPKITSDEDPLISRKGILIHISGGLVSILIFLKHFLSVLIIPKTFVFFFRTSGEYSKKKTMIRFHNGSFKTDLKNGFLSISITVFTWRSKE